MTNHFLPATLCVISAALLQSQAAFASPRFTVANDTDTKINVYIFKGDDSLCTVEEKLKSLSAGETDEYGCTGNGKGQCKVQFYAYGSEICKDDRNTCNKDAIKVPGKSEITLTKSGDDFYCEFAKG